MSASLPRWARLCGYGAIGAALPSALWRLVLGLGFTMGTPGQWRAGEDLPGSGTAYVLGLSTGQLIAASLTLALVTPGWDRLPPVSGRRLPAWIVVSVATVGAVGLAVICAGSVLHWDKVDPFAGAPTSAWSVLCQVCYAVALLWPVLLFAAIVGYARSRREAVGSA